MAPLPGAGMGRACGWVKSVVPLRLTHQPRVCALLGPAGSPSQSNVRQEGLARTPLRRTNRDHLGGGLRGGRQLQPAVTAHFGVVASSSASVADGELSKAARRARTRQTEERYICPGCERDIRDRLYRKHLDKCCPDIVPPGRWPGSAEAAPGLLAAEVSPPYGDTLMQWMQCSAERMSSERLLVARLANRSAQRMVGLVAEGLAQKAKQERVLALSFHGEERLGPEEVAALVGCSPLRVRQLIRKASKAIALVLDKDEPVEVLYEDDTLIALNKPPLIRMAPRHRFEGGSMLNRLMAYLNEAKTAEGAAVKPHIVHRLDMDTSGVVIFAKTPEAANHICAQFRARTASKNYIALCVGAPANSVFKVDAAIGPCPEKKEARKVRDDGDPSLTDFECLARGDWHGREVCAMRATPRTGRTHQIRLHLAHVELPILGDILYLPLNEDHPTGSRDKEDHEAHAAEMAAARKQSAGTGEVPPLPHPDRQALHAAALTIKHPATNVPITFHAPLPPDMREVARVLNLGALGVDRA